MAVSLLLASSVALITTSSLCCSCESANCCILIAFSCFFNLYYQTLYTTVSSVLNAIWTVLEAECTNYHRYISINGQDNAMQGTTLGPLG